MPRYRIGIDVGGTFTDFVCADLTGHSLRFHKEPSVPADPSLAVDRGMRALLADNAIAPGEVELVVHGTTLGLNAIIQRRGARLALVVSRGNRDLLELARLRLPSSYDFTVPREIPLVPRTLVFEADARMRSDGSLITPLTDAEADRIAAAIAAADVDAVAILLLNSYRDPSLEIELGDALRGRLPGLRITESAVLWPEIREYERGLVAGLNAYIHPLMSQYFDRLAERMTAQGVTAPIYITANNGGTLALVTARARPIDTVLSGPAAGVVSSIAIGAAADRVRLITFDMGGTSADISICRTGTPEFTTATTIGDFPLIMPVVNVSAIGAGGGSLVWVDAQGVLKVGPLSAGADPGPACYGRGGADATVTDCYLVLGIISPSGFLGGRMTLDSDAARAALERIAERIGFAGPHRAERTAEAALRVASAKMATEITKFLATAGVDPRDYTLVAYGGAGPTHACLLADEVPLDAVAVPSAPGTFCALGAILADVRRDYVRTARHLISNVAAEQNGWPAIAAALAALEAEARDWLAREGGIVGETGIAVSFNLRYRAQAYEIEVRVPDDFLRTLDAPGLCGLFHEEHERLYGFRDTDVPVQTATVRLAVIGRVAAVRMPPAPAHAPVPPRSREIWIDGGKMIAQVHRRGDLGAGAVVAGPAIIEQLDTTTLVLPGWRAEADALGTLHLTRSVAP